MSAAWEGWRSLLQKNPAWVARYLRRRSFSWRHRLALACSAVTTGGVVLHFTLVVWPIICDLSALWATVACLVCAGPLLLMLSAWAAGAQPPPAAPTLLDLLHPAIPYPSLSACSAARQAWAVPLRQLSAALKQLGDRWYRRRIGESSLVLLLLACQVWASPHRLRLRWPAVSKPPTVTLEVLRGGVGEPQGDTVDVQADHILRLTATWPEAAPERAHARLVTSGSRAEGFLLDRDPGSGRFSASFAADSSATLWLDELRVAEIRVHRQEIPRVQLEAPGYNSAEPWPDHLPLELKVSGKSANPLAEVSLEIITPERHDSEVIEVLGKRSEPVLTFSLDHTVFLETFMNSDLAEIELRARAVDTAQPQPGIGVSDTLVVRVISAYGLYKDALAHLKRLSHLLEHSQGELTGPGQEATELADKAETQASATPFFDDHDRAVLGAMRRQLDQLVTHGDSAAGEDLLAHMRRFLFQHEMLDDQERDQDFFVGVRALSRVLEQSEAKRPIPVERAVDSLVRFVEERRARWAVRSTFLAQHGNEAAQAVVAEWQRIESEQPFLGALERTRARGAEELAPLVAGYKKWTEELAAAENELRQKLEKEHQEKMRQSNDELRQLQVEQSKISRYLDRASSQPATQLAAGWAVQRLRQNDLAERTHKVATAARRLMPLAAERLTLAEKAMHSVVEAGEEGQFAEAESAADFAGRMLRYASDAGAAAQQRQGGRRRRRVGTDQTFGRAIHGGAIPLENNYEVDQIYRQDVLERIEAGKRLRPESASFLDRYLLRLIR